MPLELHEGLGVIDATRSCISTFDKQGVDQCKCSPLNDTKGLGVKDATRSCISTFDKQGVDLCKCMKLPRSCISTFDDRGVDHCFKQDQYMTNKTERTNKTQKKFCKGSPYRVKKKFRGT